MIRLITYLLFVCISFSVFGQKVDLIPAVNNQQTFAGSFQLNSETGISFKHSDSLKNEAEYLKSVIGVASNFNTQLRPPPGRKGNNILLSVNSELLEKGKETYLLSIKEDGIKIQGATRTGVMRGIQTLRQLFHPKFHAPWNVNAWTLPLVEIADYPHYEHRGFMLDVCRHYFDAAVVKEYIDLLAFYRMNVLHLHLTEDQGWRFASEKYPLLNTISSTRTELNGEQYGGLFTKEELKEIVAYASERHITVIPEIEMPGHSQAALAAYPHLSCTGEDVEVANDWGVFKEIYCAGNDSTFIFLETILDEVMEIFPSKYIHIGGDEAPKQRWEQCDKCQKRIKDEGLENEQELQSYFIKRIDEYLADHGKSIIGWDEILEGGLCDGATVQSWRGYEGGIEAANQEHKVIMSPTSHCYLDYGLSSIDVQKIYSFNPEPADPNFTNSEFIIGGECNMWTEHVPDRKTLDKMVFPRLIAFSEALWTSPSESMYPSFYERLQTHYPVLDKFGIQYGLEMVPVKLKDSIINEKTHIAIEHAMPEFKSMYKWRNENTIEEYENYTSPITLNQSGIFVVQPLKNGQFYGEEILQSYEFHRAINSKATYKSIINKWYTAGGEKALINGKLGSLDFRDGNWQGFWGKDLMTEIELEKSTEIVSVEMNFYHYANAWIVQPKEVIIQTSEDGKKWTKPKVVKLDKPAYDNQKKIISARVDLKKPTQSKHIRISAINSGKMPEHHDAAGEPSWIFIDEIIVK